MKTVVLELMVAVVRLLPWVAVGDKIAEMEEVVTVNEVTVIDERIVVAVDEREDAIVDEAKVGAVNVNPLIEGVGSDNPALDGSTIVIKCCMGIV